MISQRCARSARVARSMTSVSLSPCFSYFLFFLQPPPPPSPLLPLLPLLLPLLRLLLSPGTSSSFFTVPLPLNSFRSRNRRHWRMLARSRSHPRSYFSSFSIFLIFSSFFGVSFPEEESVTRTSKKRKAKSPFDADKGYVPSERSAA